MNDKNMFDTRAQNIVNAVMQMGSTAVPQVSEVVRDVHQSAIEMVAEDITKKAEFFMREKPDADKYRFLMQLVQEVRSLKGGKRNL